MPGNDNKISMDKTIEIITHFYIENNEFFLLPFQDPSHYKSEILDQDEFIKHLSNEFDLLFQSEALPYAHSPATIYTAQGKKNFDVKHNEIKNDYIKAVKKCSSGKPHLLKKFFHNHTKICNFISDNKQSLQASADHWYKTFAKERKTNKEANEIYHFDIILNLDNITNHIKADPDEIIITKYSLVSDLNKLDKTLRHHDYLQRHATIINNHIVLANAASGAWKFLNNTLAIKFHNIPDNKLNTYKHKYWREVQNKIDAIPVTINTDEYRKKIFAIYFEQTPLSILAIATEINNTASANTSKFFYKKPANQQTANTNAKDNSRYPENIHKTY